MAFTAANAVVHWRGISLPGETIVDETGGGTDLASASVPSVASGGYFSVGGNANDGTQRIDGGVDELLVFNKVLSSAEEDDLYAAGSGLAYPFTGATNESALLAACVAAYHLDEASGTRDEATGDASNDLTSTGGVDNRAGKIGNAANFSGSNQLHNTGTADLSFGNASKTVSCWVLLDTKGSAGQVQSFVLKWDKTFSCPEISLYYHNTADRFCVDWGEGGSNHLWNNGVVIANNFGSPSTATWYHVIFSYNHTTSTLRIRVNGGTANTLTPIAQPYVGSTNPVTGEAKSAIGYTKGTVFTPASQIAGYDAEGPHYSFKDNVAALNGGNQSWSLSFWMKHLNYTLNRIQLVMGKYNLTGAVIDYLVNYDGGNTRMDFQISDGGGSNFAFVRKTLADNNWHLWCMTVTPGGNITISQDAGTRVTAAIGFTPASTSTQFRIGSPVGDTTGARQLEAELKSITKWNVALTTTDEATLYNAGAGLAYPFGSSTYPAAADDRMTRQRRRRRRLIDI